MMSYGEMKSMMGGKGAAGKKARVMTAIAHLGKKKTVGAKAAHAFMKGYAK